VERLTGHPRQHVLAGYVRTWDVVHPDDRVRIDQRTEGAVRSGVPWENYFRMIQASGAIIHVYEIGNAIRDEAGVPIHYEGMVIDVSEMRSQRDAAAGIDQSLAFMIREADKITRLMASLRLLALNARIESARFGQKGSGFAAVASEMKHLSHQGDALIHAISDKKDELLSRIQAA
jgi:PAS domain S-box-containing protein